MKKKLAALVLAATMVMASGLTVFAAGNVDNESAATGTEVTGTGSINLPVIDVTVPTSLAFAINPFQLAYTMDEKDYSDQIVCVPQTITNASNVAIAVNVKELTAKDVAEGITVSTTPLTSKVTTKSIFLYLDVTGSVKDEEGNATVTFSEYNAKNSNQVAIPCKKDAVVEEGKTITKAVEAASKDSLIIMEAKGESETTAQFKIGGSVVANPQKPSEDDPKVMDNDPWTDGDKFNVSFKFTFTPQIATPAAGATE